MGEGNEDYNLRKAIKSSLILASEKGFTSISMPAISSGIFRFFLRIDVQKIIKEESKSVFQGNNNNNNTQK